MKRLVVSLAVLVLATLSGCATTDQPSEIHADGAAALPSGSLQNWVTYGDYVVEWKAVSDKRLPPTPEEVEHNEGTITRLVTVENSRVLWKRPTAPDDLKTPKTLDVANGGWVFHGQDETPFVVGDDPRLEVGQNYLAVLSYTNLTAGDPQSKGPEWIALNYFTLDSGAVVAGKNARGEVTDLNKLINGKALPAVQALVGATPIDPAAKRYMDLDPVIRYQRVAEAKIALSSHTPGPGPGEKE